MNNQELENWIEKFYSDLERDLYNYKRPKDYKERALRILKGKRSPCGTNREGKTCTNYWE